MNKPLINFEVSGRVIAAKSDYLRAHPTHNVISKAYIFTRNKGRVWWGDIDLTADASDLIRLATSLNETIYVFREHDGRFRAVPIWEHAVARYVPRVQGAV